MWQMKNTIVFTADQARSFSADPNCSFFKSKGNKGSSQINNLLIHYKTLCVKRMHEVHNDPIPSREWQPQTQREQWLPYPQTNPTS
jgi:hypothetical protein